MTITDLHVKNPNKTHPPPKLDVGSQSGIAPAPGHQP